MVDVDSFEWFPLSFIYFVAWLSLSLFWVMLLQHAVFSFGIASFFDTLERGYQLFWSIYFVESDS